MITWKFDLPQGRSGSKKRPCISSVEIREVNGEDESMAEAIAGAKGKDKASFFELVRLSIVEVDGRPVEQPYTAMDEWNTYTRTLVAKAFNSINAIEDVDIGFLEAAQPRERKQLTRIAAVSGEDG